MTKVLVTLSMAFDMDEDRLHELMNGLDDRVREGIEEALEERGVDDETRAVFWDEFEYYGATASLKRERV